MKKMISQVLLIFLIMIIGIISVFITEVKADSKASINCVSSITVGQNFTVSLNLPSNVYAAESDITVKFSDGTTSTKRIVYVNGMANFPNSAVFTASVTGNATVTASNIVLSDEGANTLEQNGSTTATINIVENTPPPATPPASSENNNQVSFTDVNETVYTTDRCNIRSSYSTSSTKLGTVNSGTALKRTGVGSNGWSRIEYKGQTAYISSQYVTTKSSTNEQQPTEEPEGEVSFKDVNETMYATKSCNLRKSWSTSSEKVGSLKAGEQVKRTGVADNGWSRINYGGKVVYVASNLLSSKPIEEDTNTTNEVADENTVQNEVVEGEKTDLELIQEEVGVYPEVGNNIANYAYIAVTIIAILGTVSGICYLKINNKEER